MKVRAFTDGACSGNPGPGGYGIIINTDTNCITLSGCENNTTNNRMELKAIVECLSKIADNSIQNKYNIEIGEVELYSDSAYCVNAINQNWIVKWKRNQWKTSKGDDVKNKDLWLNLIEQLKKIKQLHIKVQFIKIKGHAGNTFNERVDALAKSEILNLK